MELHPGSFIPVKFPGCSVSAAATSGSVYSLVKGLSEGSC